MDTVQEVAQGDCSGYNRMSVLVYEDRALPPSVLKGERRTQRHRKKYTPGALSVLNEGELTPYTHTFHFTFASSSSISSTTSRIIAFASLKTTTPLSTQLDITGPFHTDHESPKLPPLVRLNIRGSSSPSSTSILFASHSSTSTPLPSPRLVTYESESLSAGTISLVFIESIQRVEINETRVRGGETFFVLDVFMYHFDTRLPTNLAYLRRVLHSNSPDSSITVKANARPDYQVERRFIDFCDLRHQVYDAACLNPGVRCTSCDEFICYVRFKLRQPRPVAHLLTTGRRAARRAILTAFVNDFLHMALCRDKQNPKCESHGLMLVALEAFLRDIVSSSLSSSRLIA